MTEQASATCDLFAPPHTRPLLNEGLLYSGDTHGPVPRQLFTDNRLTPLERNAWQLFRMTLASEGISPLPTYEQLQPYMTTMPCGAKASHETIARALTLLRLSRWMTLFQKRRDKKTGRMLTNLYVLHDYPLTPYEATKLDPSYLTLVCHSLKHASKAVQRVARQVVQDILLDPLFNIIDLPEELRRLTGQAHDVIDQHTPTVVHVANSEVTAPDSYPQDARPRYTPNTLRAKASTPHDLNPKSNRSTLKDKKKLSTEPLEQPELAQPLRYPALFIQLKVDQQSQIKTTMSKVPGNLRQAVLDEWSVRCQKQQVRSPAGYLYGLLQKALRGEFKPWAARQQSPAASTLTVLAPPRQRHDTKRQQPTLARAYLAQLRAMLNIGTQPTPALPSG
ncbi:STY4528 family pathogenicity island replication protein [Pseudomonas huaxiensis]|uniref:STY4528 family pathogenicity island replication protein n=1 Tax=Pseudomonas huaxiensis TaxID=2213017 RepID=UPI0013009A33|nr:STY4528 family pathogenicity island replication protein [Pseudomonas huaxiensis]